MPQFLKNLRAIRAGWTGEDHSHGQLQGLQFDDRDQSILGDAYNLAGLDFTTDEQERISEFADELRRILDAARTRMQIFRATPMRRESMCSRRARR
jgi:hypothetical protein